MAMNKYRVMTILGTRPEVIKCAPVICELSRYPREFESLVVVTGQHRDMLDQMLKQFSLKPDYDLNIMQPQQTLEQVTASAISLLTPLIKQTKPHLILVQGDTISTFAGALAGFYQQVPVAHIEAGLRTYHHYHPFPEEINRRLVDVISTWHFAATPGAKKNLIKENIPSQRIAVTGNTVVDSAWAMLDPAFDLSPWIQPKQSLVMVTMHRRENYGGEFLAICRAVDRLTRLYPDSKFIFPVHPNPKVKLAIKRGFKKRGKNLQLITALDYNVFINLLSHAQLVITDSGGIQEEAAALAVPMIICRQVTERPEALGPMAKLIKPHAEKIVRQAIVFLNNKKKLTVKTSAFGDGHAARRIVDWLRWINGSRRRRPRPFNYEEIV